MAKPTRDGKSSEPARPNILANLKKQMNENALEIFVALTLALIGFGFINSFGKYILLVVLIGGLFVVWLHDKPKIFPWIMLVIGILLGFVAGNNISGLAEPKLKPSLTTVLPEQWLEEGEALRIIDGSATLSCEHIWFELREAGCQIAVIGQQPEGFAFTEYKKDYLFKVGNDSYLVSMIDMKKWQVLITITLVPQELLPTLNPTLTH